ncbi:MAG: hypothetical protein M1818_001282 [Claussenomyces sp. TS43310]|nr:MAG: hypothetical protein M1818_001282 [Claussenomyces sp. TS43310]
MAQPSATFHLFPQLPTEIRLQIWREMPSPRLIELGTKNCSGLEPSSIPFEMLRNGRATRLIICSGERYPPTLAVCRESRQETLPSYDALPLGHDVGTSPSSTPRHRRPHLWINYTQDTLFFGLQAGYYHLRALFAHGVLLQAQNLAVTASLWPALDYGIRRQPNRAKLCGERLSDPQPLPRIQHISYVYEDGDACPTVRRRYHHRTASTDASADDTAAAGGATTTTTTSTSIMLHDVYAPTMTHLARFERPRNIALSTANVWYWGVTESRILDGFRDEKRQYPDWAVPRVRIVADPADPVQPFVGIEDV